MTENSKARGIPAAPNFKILHILTSESLPSSSFLRADDLIDRKHQNRKMTKERKLKQLYVSLFLLQVVCGNIALFKTGRNPE